MSEEKLIALLAEAQDAEVMQTSIGSSEDNLQVDWEARKVIIPASVTNAGVIGDHLSKKLVLEMDRYVNGHDIAEHTFAIHFMNVKRWEGPDKEYREIASGVYPVTSIDTSVEGKVICEWEITNASTQIVGDLGFSLHVFTIVDGSFTYHLGVQAAVLDMLSTINATDHGGNMATGVSDEKIAEAVAAYLEENPVSGMTDEQVAQMNRNTSDIRALKEAMGSYITDIDTLVGGDA